MKDTAGARLVRGREETAMEEKEQLRREKEQLTREKEELRREKEQLRKEKEQLRRREKQLRDLQLAPSLDEGALVFVLLLVSVQIIFTS